jgi:hypothetical protein
MSETAGKYFEIARRQPTQPMAQSAGGSGAGAGGKAPDIKLFENMKAAGKVTADVYAQFGDVRSYVQSMKSSYGIDPTRVTDPTNQLEVRANQQYQQSIASLYTNMNALQRQQEDYKSFRDASNSNPDVQYFNEGTGQVGGGPNSDAIFEQGNVINTEANSETKIHNLENAQIVDDKGVEATLDARATDKIDQLKEARDAAATPQGKASIQAQINQIEEATYDPTKNNQFYTQLRKAQEDPKIGTFNATVASFRAGDYNILNTIDGITPMFNQQPENMYNPITGEYTFMYKDVPTRIVTKGKTKQQLEGELFKWYQKIDGNAKGNIAQYRNTTTEAKDDYFTKNNAGTPLANFWERADLTAKNYNKAKLDYGTEIGEVLNDPDNASKSDKHEKAAYIIQTLNENMHLLKLPAGLNLKDEDDGKYGEATISTTDWDSDTVTGIEIDDKNLIVKVLAPDKDGKMTDYYIVEPIEGSELIGDLIDQNYPMLRNDLSAIDPRFEIADKKNAQEVDMQNQYKNNTRTEEIADVIALSKQ